MRMLNVQVSMTPSGTTAELMLKVKVVSTLHVWQSVLVVHDRGPPSVQLPLTQRLAAQSVLVVQLCAPPPQFRAEEALWLVGEPEIAGLIVHAPEVATLKVVLSNLMKLEVPTTLLPFLVRVMSMLTFCPAKPVPLPTLTSGGVAHAPWAVSSVRATRIARIARCAHWSANCRRIISPRLSFPRCVAAEFPLEPAADPERPTAKHKTLLIYRRQAQGSRRILGTAGPWLSAVPESTADVSGRLR